MKTSDEIFDFLSTEVLPDYVCDDEVITVDVKLEDTCLDSIDLIEIVMFLEEQYEVEIDDDTISEFITIGDMVKAVCEQLGEK